MISKPDFEWVERYRPRKIDDVILPETLKKLFIGFRDQGNIPNMTLTGGPGIGKTTIVLALCDELDADFLKINASKDGNIDTLRTDIQSFASTISMTGGRKVVFLDEADGLTPLTQNALRGFIEEYSSNCSFVLTANYKNKITDALQSRCPIIDFNIPKEEKATMAKNMGARVQEILTKENVKFDKKVVVQIVVKFFPDFRETLGQLQKYAVTGNIDEGILGLIQDVPIKVLVEALKKKAFGDVRKWVAQHMSNDPIQMYRMLYDSMTDYFVPSSIPQFVLCLGDAIDQASRSLDQEVCSLAFLVRLMSDDDIKFK